MATVRNRRGAWIGTYKSSTNKSRQITIDGFLINAPPTKRVSYTAALEWVTAYEKAQRDLADRLPTPEGSWPTILDLVHHKLAKINTTSSRRDYMVLLNHPTTEDAKAVLRVPLDQVQVAHYKAYHDSLPVKTRRDTMRLLERILLEAIEAHQVPPNTVLPRVVPLAARPTTETPYEESGQPYSLEEVRSLFASAPSDVDAALLACMFYTGAKTVELYRLNKEKVDFAARTLTLKDGRKQAFPVALDPYLKRWIKLGAPAFDAHTRRWKLNHHRVQLTVVTFLFDLGASLSDLEAWFPKISDGTRKFYLELQKKRKVSLQHLTTSTRWPELGVPF